jgi:hypothetical protein
MYIPFGHAMRTSPLSLLGLLMLAGSLYGQQHWWEREPLRIVDLETSFTQIDYRDPAQLAAQKAALGYNAEHFEVMGMAGGLDDQQFYFRSSVAGKVNPDYLKRYLPEAKKHGIRTFIYFNVHWHKGSFAEQHHDWQQIRQSGKPLDGVYDTGSDFCVNSGYREWVFQVLRDLAAYSIDGIFFDGPVFRPDTCYCNACRAKYRKRFGAEMPPKSERSGEGFARLLDFQAESVADFLHDSRQVLKSINPEIALYMNGGVRGANWPTGRLNRTLVREQDLLGSEGGFIGGDLTRVPLWKPGLSARLLETQAAGKPTIIFSAASLKPWTFSLLPAPELRLLYADSIANAAGVWFGITPFELEEPEMKSLAEMNRYLAANSRYYQKTRSEAKVAVVWSEVTADFYAGGGAQLIDIDRVARKSEIGDLDQEFGGISEALLRAHTPFDVIDDVTLDTGSLDRYEAVFLPNVACMSDRTAARLREYVRNGGHLFATFETSLYSETGIRRNNFALADVFGASDARKLAGPMRWDFAQPVAADPLLDGVNRRLLPAPAYHVRVAGGPAKVLVKFMQPLAGRYDGVPGPSDDAFVLTQQFGKGSVVYISGDLGATISSFHMPEYLGLVRNVVRSFAPPTVDVEGAPGSVEVVLRSQESGKRLLVHLVNFTGEMTRPIHEVLPLSKVRLTLARGTEVSSAYTLRQPRKLPVVAGPDGRKQVVLPELNEYEVVVLEK